jgi:hypothetical protein
MRNIILALAFLPCLVLADWTPSAFYIDTAQGNPDIHEYSGSKRTVRRGDTIFALQGKGGATSNTEAIKRSTDGGTTWTTLDTVGRYGGCITSGKNGMIYVFEARWGGDNLAYKKYKFSSTSPVAATQFYSHADISNTGKSGSYRMVSCAVDSMGIPYAAYAWAPAAATTLDRVYTFWWTDTSLATVRGPYQASNLNTSRWYYQNIEVGPDNKPVMTMYDETISKIVFTRDDEHDSTWGNYSTVDSTNGTAIWSNPSMVVKNTDSIIVVYQSGDLATAGDEGGNVKVSSDNGVTWGSRVRIARTCGYFDPSAAIGSDGSIYVAARSSMRTGSACGDSLYAYMYHSTDFGATWAAVDSAPPPLPKVGTRVHVRYQNWHGYGGPLTWTWMGVMTGKKALMGDQNTDVTVQEVFQEAGSSVPSGMTLRGYGR